MVCLPGPRAAILRAQAARVKALEKKRGQIIPFLFPYLGGPSHTGQPRRDFGKTWASAGKAAGAAGRP